MCSIGSRLRSWFLRRRGSSFEEQTQHDLLARLSHELRTSLTGIVGYAEFLEANAEEPMMKFTAKIIRESGLNLVRSSHSYFDFQYLMRGQLRVESTLFQLSVLIQEILDKNQSHAIEQGVSFVFTCPDEAQSRFIFCDANRIRQALDALVFDVLQGGEKWSIIRIELALDAHKNSLVLSIDKSIDAKDQSQSELHDKFWNSDNYRFRLQQGPGVELAYAKALLQFLGATALFKKIEGASSRLVLRFPLPERNA